MPVALGTGEAVVGARGGRGLQLGGRAGCRDEGGGTLAGGELGLAAGSPRRGVEVGQVWVGQQAGAGGGRGGQEGAVLGGHGGPRAVAEVCGHPQGPLGVGAVVEGWLLGRAKGAGGLTAAVHSGGHAIAHLPQLKVAGGPLRGGTQGVIAGEGSS